MKKLLLVFTLFVCTIFSFSQEISVAKSSLMSFGEKNLITGKFDFSDFQDIPQVIVLVKKNRISVDSKVNQEYFIDGPALPLEDAKGSYWYAYDVKGIKCRVYLYMDTKQDLFFAVEYNDYSWIYSITPVK